MNMNCQEFVEFILSYLEGDLPHAVRSVFEQHLRACPPCETYLATYQRLIQLEREAFCEHALPPADDVPESLVRAILEARRHAPPTGGPPPT